MHNLRQFSSLSANISENDEDSDNM